MAIKTTITDSSKSGSHNADPKITKGFKYPKLNEKSTLLAYGGQREVRRTTGQYRVLMGD